MKVRIVMGLSLLLAALVAGWSLARAQGPPQPAKPEQSADSSAEPAQEKPLDMLDWLVGDWVDENENVSVEFSCHFTKNGAFLVRSFSILNAKNVSMSGMQLIAWDAAKEAIRSWTYDSQGGFGEESWTQSGNRYTIRCKYTLPDGGTGSNIQVITFIDNDKFTWKSVSREIDGELQPDTDEIVLIRKTVELDAQGEK
jgi:hypothetical protein